MKNSTVKTLGIIALAAIALVAMNKLKKGKEEGTLALASDKSIPEIFIVKDNDSQIDVSTHYSIKDGKYYSQMMGPTIRSTPLEITKEEYTKAYSAYLA